MNRDLKNIDKLFHETLSGAGEQPPVHVWDNIENTLSVADAQKSIGKERKRKRFILIAFFIIAAGAATLVWKTNGKTTDAVFTDNQTTNTQDSSIIDQTAADKTSDQANLTVEKNINSVTSKNAAGDKIIVSPSHHNSEIQKENSQQTMLAARAFNANASDYPGLRRKTTQSNNSNANDDSWLTCVTGPVDSIKQNTSIVSNGQHPSEEQIKQETDPVKNIEIVQALQRPAIPDAAKIENGNADLIAPKAAPLVKTKKPGRFSVIAFFAPDITTRNLEQNFGTTRDERKEELMRTEKNNGFDFTVGARLEYRLSRHFSLQSGLSFSTNTIDIAQKTIFARFDNRDGSLKYRFNFSSGYAYFKPKTLSAPRFLGDSAQALSSTSTLHYINIPLSVKYYFSSWKRFNFSLQAGITARFIAKQSIDAVYALNGTNEKGRTNDIQGLKRTYFNGVVGLGADYTLGNKLSLTFFPSFNFATTSINRDAPVKAYPNTLSVALGLKMQL